MYTYNIKTTNKINGNITANSPVQAISKAFGKCEIKAVEKGTKGANFCLTFLGGYLNYKGYYIVKQATSNIPLPQLIAYDIKWSTDGSKVSLPKEIKLPCDKLWESDEDISDYLSEQTGFCHAGFKLKCDMSADKMNKKVTKLKQMAKNPADTKKYGKSDLLFMIKLYESCLGFTQ